MHRPERYAAKQTPSSATISRCRRTGLFNALQYNFLPEEMLTIATLTHILQHDLDTGFECLHARATGADELHRAAEIDHLRRQPHNGLVVG